MSLSSRRRFLSLTLGAGASLGLTLLARQRWGMRNPFDTPESGSDAPLVPVMRTSFALGTSVSLTALHGDPATAERAIAAAFEELDRVENVLSLYRPRSELSRLNRDGALADPHPDLVTVLSAACEMSRQSDGAFDVTVQPLWALHAEAARAGRLPSSEELSAAREAVDWRRVEISAKGIAFRGAGTAVTLNGIAQGFATDRVQKILRDHGIEHALINAGEIGTIGDKGHGEPWRAGIQHPRHEEAWIAVARLDGRCLATSGDYATTFSPDRANNHVFDPRTGRSPDVFASVSVVAPTGMLADALSTAVCVGGLEKGLALVGSTPGADALCVLKSGEVRQTEGFPCEA